MKSLSSSQDIKEYKKSYLIEIKKEIENRRKIKEVNKEDQIRKEKEMLSLVNKQFDYYKSKAELEDKRKKEEFVNRLNLQRKEKEGKENKLKDDKKILYNSSIMLDSNDDPYSNSHSNSYRQGSNNNDQNIRQDLCVHQKKTYNQLHPDIEYLHNNEYIYFKNKEIGHSGEFSYKNKENMINEVINKYNNQTKNEKSIGKVNQSLVSNENSLFSYEFKKRKDQMLVKSMLDEQIKKKNEMKSNLTNEERLFQLKFQRTSLVNNVILNPIDDYTHNKYINRLRVKEGVGFVENKV